MKRDNADDLFGLGKVYCTSRGFMFHSEMSGAVRYALFSEMKDTWDWVVFQGQFECRYDTSTSQVSASNGSGC